MYRIGRYLIGDTNEDGSKYLPFDDKYMKYNIDEQKYELTQASTSTFLNLNLKSKFGDSKEAEVFLREQEDNVMIMLLQSPYNDLNSNNVKYLIARTAKGRSTIQKAYIAQVRWAVRFGKDMMEEEIISPSAKRILQNGKLWHKGKWAQMVDPEEKDVNY